MSTTAARPNSGRTMKSGDLAAEVVQDLNRLLSLEVALAKQELKELAVTNAIAAACFAAAAVLALLALLVAVPAFVVLVVPWHWEAAVVWAVAYVLMAMGLALYGRTRLRVTLPKKTINSLKETKEWALQRMRSTAR